MASYTLTLKECLETLLAFDSVDVSKLTTKEMIEEGRKRLFDFEYKIFDSNYKSIFETKFIRNFFFREIGFETENLFKFQLETWLLIHMPYFNKLFQSELISFNPLVNSEMRNEWERKKDTDGHVDLEQNNDENVSNKQSVSGSQNSNGFSRGLEHDTPDGRLAITTEDGKGIIEYASKIEEDTSKSNTTSTNIIDGSNTVKSNTQGKTNTDINETEEYLQSRIGKIGSVTYSKMLQEYRESFLRIEKQMFDEMQQLFMLVY